MPEKKEPKCCCREHAGANKCPDCPIHANPDEGY